MYEKLLIVRIILVSAIIAFILAGCCTGKFTPRNEYRDTNIRNVVVLENSLRSIAERAEYAEREATAIRDDIDRLEYLFDAYRECVREMRATIDDYRSKAEREVDKAD